MNRPTTLTLTVVAGFALLSGMPGAEPLPRVDADSHCRSQVSNKWRFGTPQEKYQQCFKEQQEAYDKLKARWDAVEEEDQRACLKWSLAEHAYSSLESCIGDMEKSRAYKKRELDREAEFRAIPKQELRW